MKHLIFGFSLMAFANLAFVVVFIFMLAFSSAGNFSNFYLVIPLLLSLTLNIVIVYGLEMKRRWVFVLASLEIAVIFVFAFIYVWTTYLPTIFFSVVTMMICVIGLKLIFQSVIEFEQQVEPHA